MALGKGRNDGLRCAPPILRALGEGDAHMYRYSSRKFNDLLRVMGCIRIGTLYDFRRIEHGHGIGDPREGTKAVGHHIDHLFVGNPSDPHLTENKDMRALKAFRAVEIGKEARNTTIRNMSVSRSVDVPDCFILCSSKYKSKEAMNQFEGADSCVQIVDVGAFYRRVTQAIDRITPVIFRGIFEVTYQEREELWNGRDWGRHPALIKEPKYIQQGELRAIWQPQFQHEIEPLITGDYRLGAYVKYVHIE